MPADKPIGIAFSPALVREVLAGRKSMTRRIAKGAFESDAPGAVVVNGRCSYGAPGSMLYVKEQLRRADDFVSYDADGAKTADVWPWQVRVLTARYCPRWASRISLRVTDVRVERVQSISDEDVAREGISVEVAESMVRNTPGALKKLGEVTHSRLVEPLERWRIAWTLINGAESWRANPFVWVIAFENANVLAQGERAGAR